MGFPIAWTHLHPKLPYRLCIINLFKVFNLKLHGYITHNLLPFMIKLNHIRGLYPRYNSSCDQPCNWMQQLRCDYIDPLLFWKKQQQQTNNKNKQKNPKQNKNGEPLLLIDTRRPYKACFSHLKTTNETSSGFSIQNIFLTYVERKVITSPHTSHCFKVPGPQMRGGVKHICINKLTIIGSDNGLSPNRRQAIIWASVGML